MRHLLATLAAVALLCAACTDGKVYDFYQHTSPTGWEKSDTLAFSVPRLARAGRYATDLGLRIDGGFPFVSITLIVDQTVFPAGQLVSDTVRCQLTDSRGHFTGTGISNYQYHCHVSEMMLAQGDSLHITVRHDMRRDIMPGISDVGVEVRRLGE